jgi:hypothetical protein
MAKSKLGLQKEVSKIFLGIQIPKKDTAGKDARSTSPASPIIPPAQVAPAPIPAMVTPPAPVIPPVSVPSAPVSVASAAAPVAPAPAKYTSPKPAAAAPKPFTIPEPTPQSTPQASRQTVYEPPKSRQATYEPPAHSPKPSPAPSTAPAPVSEKQSRPEPVVKQHRELPFLKIWEQVKVKLLTPKRGTSPTKQKVMILAAPVLLVVFILVITQAVKKSPSTTAKPSKKASAAVAFEGKINWELPAVIPDNLRDPMVFGATGQSKETTSGPVVKGIVYSEDNPCAVVGDRIVSVGDTVGGATVVKINTDSVEFAMGDKNWTQKVER